MEAFRGAGRYTIDIGFGRRIAPDPLAPALIYNKIENYRITMSGELPKQTIRLRSIKILLDTVQRAENMRSLGFKFPFLSYNHTVDNNPSVLTFTFPLNTESVLTYEHALEKPLYMNEAADRSYLLTVLDAEGNVADGINCIYLDFETEIGSIGS